MSSASSSGFVGARADAEHQSLVAIVGGDIGVAHVGIDVDPLAGLQRDRIVEFGVDDDRPFEDVDIFLARVADEVAELAQRLGRGCG